VADWGSKMPSPMCNDPFYVLVYDVEHVMDSTTAARHPECLQEDGFARTMHFVKIDEFINWYDTDCVRAAECIHCRYDIDPLGYGVLTPNHIICQVHRLLEVKINFFEDLARTHHKRYFAPCMLFPDS
jgi:hypothetical protein